VSSYITGIHTQRAYIVARAPGHPVTGKSAITFLHRILLYDKIGGGLHSCHYCHTPLAWQHELQRFPVGTKKLLVDHVNNNPSDNADGNLVPCCHACNCKKNSPLSIKDGEAYLSFNNPSRNRLARKRAVSVNCRCCGKEFLAIAASVRYKGVSFCSPECRRRALPEIMLPTVQAKREDRIANIASGVVYRNPYATQIVVPGHPLMDGSKSVSANRYTLFEKIGAGVHKCHFCGQTLEWSIKGGNMVPGALPITVFHLDGDKNNCREDNLVPSCRACSLQRNRKPPKPPLRSALLASSVSPHPPVGPCLPLGQVPEGFDLGLEVPVGGTIPVC
jgi:hypothetical protein